MLVYVSLSLSVCVSVCGMGVLSLAVFWLSWHAVPCTFAEVTGVRGGGYRRGFPRFLPRARASVRTTRMGRNHKCLLSRPRFRILFYMLLT
ncbi:hypothetical protein LX32DRAFT_376462 [Colletotrichum zoysiae]|uniref:Uncharacterized protein n=1 Tax=Colletotrichum zoysiae TaxID=1216348 RepID=A0AAD9HH85_9PEZI|nr:hypothetical protein LX32DRAFT_376462 [Colletotrichum zoysiae]